jgi:DNA-binding NtrC family response regulator
LPEGRILVVDDDNLMREFLDETLRRSRYSVDLASTGDEALKKIKSREYDVILSDIRMPKMSGMELLKAVKDNSPQSKVMLMTAYGTIENAVEAMKLGAFDYVTKPFSADDIELKIKRAIEYKRLEWENKLLRTEVAGKYRFKNIIGKSPQIQKVFEMVDSIADSKASVLITGESGTGKELIAKAIHYNSPRKDLPFVKINCAALPENLMESELFGHEKGAFTGAIKKTRGRFELAHQGTLLLDEISEIPLSLQAKLLRVLQEREFERVGSGDTIQVDVRIISTSNQNLPELIQKGKFREDLYFRLNVIPIHIEPLRERKEDIIPLAEYFLEKYKKENNRNIKGISEKVYQMFMEYHWPGNVRELENYIERAVVTSRGNVLNIEDFPKGLLLKTEQQAQEFKVGQTVYDAEKALILKTLEACAGNRTKAAQTLGISVRTLRNKLNEYGLGKVSSNTDSRKRNR